MIIAFDLDEVLNNFMESFLLFYEEKNGKKVELSDMKSYNFWENGLGNNRDEAIEMVKEFYNSEQYNKISTSFYAKEILDKLIKAEHKVFIITSRPENIGKSTKEFVRNNFSDEIEIIYSNDFFKGNRKSKAEIAKELKVNFMVEDNINYARECAEQGINVFLVNKPWNDGEINESIIRINNLNEILEHLQI